MSGSRGGCGRGESAPEIRQSDGAGEVGRRRKVRSPASAPTCANLELRKRFGVKIVGNNLLPLSAALPISGIRSISAGSRSWPRLPFRLLRQIFLDGKFNQILHLAPFQGGAGL
jgi:hypothetical protein